MKEKWVDLLLRSIEEPLPEPEARILESALAESGALREEKQRLEEMRGAVQSLQLPSDEGFVDAVMARIEEEGSEAGSGDIFNALGRIYLRVAAACVLLIGLALFSIYWNEGSLGADPLVDADILTPEEIIALTD